MRQPRLGAADNLPKGPRTIYDSVAEIPERITERRSASWNFVKPPAGDRIEGEILLARMATVSTRRMRMGADHIDVVASGALKPMNHTTDKGAMCVTEHRVLVMGNHHLIKGKWEYATCSAITVMSSLDGVQIAHGAQPTEADYVLNHANPYLKGSAFQESLIPPLIAMFTAEGAYVLASGGDWNTFLTMLAVRLGSLN